MRLSLALALALSLAVFPSLAAESTGPASASAPSAATGLEPAFRLPVGGRTLAAPVVDRGSSPAAVWILSEDRSLYLLSENGALLSRTAMPGRIMPFLALDAAGRALTISPGSGTGPEAEARLLVWTRAGRLVLSIGLGGVFSDELARSSPSVALGADGRLFLAAGKALRCHAPSGTLLWQLGLEKPLACALATDGAGRLLVGQSDRLIVLSPYGVEEARIETSAPPTVAGPVTRAAWRALGRVASQAEGQALFAFGTADGKLRLFGPSGDLLGSRELGSVPTALASDGGSLYCLAASGRLVRVQPDGNLAWTTETGVREGSLVLHPDRLVATGRGRAASLRTDGAILREAAFTNSVAACVVSPSGLLFSPGADWILGAYVFEPPLGPVSGPTPPPYGDEPGVEEEARTYDPKILDSSHRVALLADIEKELDAGRLGAGEGQAGALASAVALGRFERDYPAAVARFRQDPLPRANAVHLLGRLGSPERIGVLCEVLKADRDSAVRAAALDAIAMIGYDPRGLAGAACEAAVAGAAARLDDQVALSLARALETLAVRSGQAPKAAAIRALLALSQAPYGADVRGAVAKALGQIAGTLGP